jgi:hypothetical protein
LSTFEAITQALTLIEGPGLSAELDRLFKLFIDRSLWSRGQLPAHAVTGGIPPEAFKPPPAAYALSDGSQPCASPSDRIDHPNRGRQPRHIALRQGPKLEPQPCAANHRSCAHLHSLRREYVSPGPNHGGSLEERLWPPPSSRYSKFERSTPPGPLKNGL